MSFREEFKSYLRAAYPILWVQTHEESRAEDELRDVAAQTKRECWTWAVTTGFIKVEKEQAETRQTDDALAALKEVAKFKEETIVCLKDFHPYFDVPVVIRRLRDMIPHLEQTGKMIVFLSPKLAIPDELEKDIVVVRFPLPKKEELGVILDELIKSVTGEAKSQLDAESRSAVLDGSLGLTIAEARNIYSLAWTKHGKLDNGALTTIRHERAQALKKSNLVTWVEQTIPVEHLGGLAGVKAYAAQIAPIFYDQESASAYGLLDEDFPRSIALVGVPGTGKSLCAKIIPGRLKIGCVQSDFGRIFSSKVGESEQNIIKRNELVEALAPCVDWWDEAEKGLAGVKGSEGNPWEARIGGTLLTWFEEFRARVLVVATINRCEMLPPEMWSRFQKVFFVDLPNEAEREDIFRIHLGMRKLELKKEDVKELAVKAFNFNGREIRNTVQQAMQAAFAEGKQKVTLDRLMVAVRGITPIAVSQKAEVEKIREWAKIHNIQPAGEVPKELQLIASTDAALRRRKLSTS